MMYGKPELQCNALNAFFLFNETEDVDQACSMDLCIRTFMRRTRIVSRLGGQAKSDLVFA